MWCRPVCPLDRRTHAAVAGGGRTAVARERASFAQSEPQPEDVTKACVAQGDMPYIRSERQCLIRLPVSRAVLFSIHTYLVPLAALTADQAAALRDFPIHTAL